MKADQLIAQLNKAIEKAIQVPNSYLPVAYHSETGYRTLSSVKRMAKIKDKIESEHKALKREKAARIRVYAQQLERGEEISYVVDEHKLYNNQLAFCSAAIKAGWLEADDFEE